MYIKEGRGFSDGSGNSGYPRLGDTSAAILQKAFELNSSTIEELLRPVAIFAQCVAFGLQPLLCVFRKSTCLKVSKSSLSKQLLNLSRFSVLLSNEIDCSCSTQCE